MKLQTVILALAGVRQVTAVPAARNTASYSEVDLVNYLRDHPEVLPHNAQKMFEYRQQEVSKTLHKRQGNVAVALLGALQNTLSSIGKPWPKSQVPDEQIRASPRFPGVQRKKIRYGPYRIPPTSEKNVEYHLLHATGMTNMFKVAATKPCAKGKDCTILGLQASLENADGTAVPNNVSGAWLHHVVLFNAGLNVKDATCGKQIEPMFESGNERSDIRFYVPDTGVKSGYHVRKEDMFLINTEFMNMEDKEKWVWLTLDFDYIEGFQPQWKEGVVVWMSIGPDRCTGNDWNPFGATNLTRNAQPIKEIFEEYSHPWVAPRDGLLLGSNSHLHDGGVDTKLFIDNEDKSICTSVAHYSAPGEAASGPKPGGHSHGRRQMGSHASTGGVHIEAQGECEFKQPITLKQGQKLFIKSTYDFTKNSGMKNAKGELDEVMAIAGALVAFDFKG